MNRPRSVVAGIRTEPAKFGKSIVGKRGSQRMHALGLDKVGKKRLDRFTRQHLDAALRLADQITRDMGRGS